jgi:hypothetical protein
VEGSKKVKTTIRSAMKKFKGEESQMISQHEGEEILLICGYKRDTIDLIMSRVKS